MNKKKGKINQIRESLKNFYDKTAESFSATRAWWWKDLDFVGKYIQEKDKVLDFGCGNGRLFDFIKNQNIEYIGVDISEKLIEIAQKKHPKIKFKTIEDETTLDFADESFDKIFAIAVFHHFNPRMLRKNLLELKRILKSDGTLIVSVWHLWNLKRIKFLLGNFLKGNFCLGGEIPFGCDKKDSEKRFCYWHTQKSLEAIFVRSGFNIEESFFTFDPKGNRRNMFFKLTKVRQGGRLSE